MEVERALDLAMVLELVLELDAKDQGLVREVVLEQGVPGDPIKNKNMKPIREDPSKGILDHHLEQDLVVELDLEVVLEKEVHGDQI